MYLMCFKFKWTNVTLRDVQFVEPTICGIKHIILKMFNYIQVKLYGMNVFQQLYAFQDGQVHIPPQVKR